MSAAEERHQELLRVVEVLSAELRQVKTMVRRRSEVPVLLTREQVAEMLHCHPRHLPKLIARREVPEGAMFGRERLWRLEDINNVLEARMARYRRN